MEKKIVGFWNPSVILTYIGMGFAVAGMFLAIRGSRINCSFICFMLSGVCDLFDGAVARRVKRNEEEKAFGVEQDSLVDVISFIAQPLVLFMAMGLTKPLFLILYLFFAVVGVARLGYYNVVTADSEGPVPYYSGLPVTYTALIFPLVYLLKYVLSGAVFEAVFAAAIFIVSVLELAKIKVVKPKGIAYAFFGILAIVMIVLFGVLA